MRAKFGAAPHVCVACSRDCVATPTSDKVTFAPTGSIANKDPGSDNAWCVPTELPSMLDACEWSQNETMCSAVTRPDLALPCSSVPCFAVLCSCVQCPLLPFASLSCNAL